MASPLPPDPYAALNVPKDATLAAVRSAYRKLVLTCHPDKVQDEALRAHKTDQFTQVQQAYEILSDEQKRRRYDDQLRSAEIRAETLMTGTRGTRIVPEFAGPRGGVFENRGEWLYEERVPRRSYDSDDMSPFEEPRVRRSTYDQATSRRSSGRVQEERRKTREAEAERERERERRTTKEAQRSSHSDRRRTRDKDRRRDYDEKRTGRRAFVEEECDSDSESTARYSSVRRDSYPRKAYEDSRRGDWDDTLRRRGQREANDYSDHYEVRLMGAQDYISKSRAVPLPEGSSRRPIPYRTVSAAQPPPPPPPPPPPEPDRRPSGGRTHGTRDSSRTRSGKSTRSPEIVDVPGKYDTPVRKPSVPNSSSDPTNLKAPTSQRREQMRSTTVQTAVHAQQEQRMPRIRRSETTPLITGSPRRPDNVPTKSSKIKTSEIHDSGYSSLSGPGTPEMAYPQQSAKYKAGVSDEDEDHFRSPPPSTKYQVVVSDEDGDRHRGHRTYLMEPEETTPKLSRRTSERPAATRVPSSSTRGPPPRSQSYAYPVESHSSPRPPPFSRSETSRPSFQTRPSTRTPMFGELTEEPLQYKEAAPYKVQYESQKIRPQDIRYAPDRRGAGASPRDPYPYAELRRPPMERRGDSYQSVCS
ncbi:DnaJ domain, conserved site [Lasallia pustulata]|uniref:DnaJ domain, conserved site n=1 Tax=Lasallia pustulata TaxID=136370 RepID=A0A1W5CWQ1_9LECA|nr:DnaJ domain, conserved site [Lasallia pustulata]